MGTTYGRLPGDVPVDQVTREHPRRSVVVMTGLLAGLRWGESGGLFKSDIDVKRALVSAMLQAGGPGILAELIGG